MNRLVKLVYRSGFGFTNVTNQQRRSRYAASRGIRPVWLSPAGLRQTAGQRDPAVTPAPTPFPLGRRRSGHEELPQAADSHTQSPRPWCAQ
ncbi:hypothetical protein ACFHYQ_09070 [Sphaerimonospora cavernae]|uniref:Uncharacterized protein n=1 Tax=Sphaerimonospora cavernae TaxID=1740611 RepID=A0ABV6U1V7_9ACTN